MMVRGHRKEMMGMVVSDKMQKTIVVETRSRVSHPLYKKEFVRKTTFVAHDEKNTAKTGDWVRIRESRPLSKTKRWKLIEVMRAAALVEEVPPKEAKAKKEVKAKASAKAKPRATTAKKATKVSA